MRKPLPLLMVAVWSIVAAGCSSSAPGPVTSTTVTSTTVPSAPAEIGVVAYLVRDEHVVPVRRWAPAGAGALGVSIEAMLAGPTSGEAALGVTTAIPDGVVLQSVYVNDGIAWIDLDRSFESGGGTSSMLLRLAQLTATATAAPEVDAVLLRLDGAWVSTFSGEGLVLDHAWTLVDIEAQLPIIAPELPAPGDVVASPIRITGTANTFEATFQVQVLDDAGGLLADATVMATSGTGTRGTFDVTLPVGDFTGPATVRLLEYSPKDGAETAVVEIPVTVTG